MYIIRGEARVFDVGGRGLGRARVVCPQLRVRKFLEFNVETVHIDRL